MTVTPETKDRLLAAYRGVWILSGGTLEIRIGEWNPFDKYTCAAFATCAKVKFGWMCQGQTTEEIALCLATALEEVALGMNMHLAERLGIPLHTPERSMA